MTTENTEPTAPKATRTQWEANLYAACEGYAAAKSRRITATRMLFPAEPGYVVRVDDLVPYPFPTAKAAALAVMGWSTAP